MPEISAADLMRLLVYPWPGSGFIVPCPPADLMTVPDGGSYYGDGRGFRGWYFAEKDAAEAYVVSLARKGLPPEENLVQHEA